MPPRAPATQPATGANQSATGARAERDARRGFQCAFGCSQDLCALVLRRLNVGVWQMA